MSVEDWNAGFDQALTARLAALMAAAIISSMAASCSGESNESVILWMKDKTFECERRNSVNDSAAIAWYFFSSQTRQKTRQNSWEWDWLQRFRQSISQSAENEIVNLTPNDFSKSKEAALQCLFEELTDIALHGSTGGSVFLEMNKIIARVLSWISSHQVVDESNS